MSDESVQSRVSEWRLRKRGWAVPDATQICAKLLEEAGEVARAVIGRLEGREGRGDIGQEAAQVVIVLLTLLGLHTDQDLFDELAKEITRLEI